MSANIYTRPVSTKKNDLNCGTPSQFSNSMQRAFNRDFPMKLGEEAIPTLRGMSALSTNASKCPYEELIRRIENQGRIEIWLEY